MPCPYVFWATGRGLVVDDCTLVQIGRHPDGPSPATFLYPPPVPAPLAPRSPDRRRHRPCAPPGRTGCGCGRLAPGSPRASPAAAAHRPPCALAGALHPPAPPPPPAHGGRRRAE